jgi:sortase A
MKGSMKRKLGWLEAGLYVGGIVLIAVYFQIRAEGERQREEGVKAFNAAAGEIVLENPYSGDSRLTVVSNPNQELWTPKRIAEYEESLKVEAEPPLALLTIEKLDIQVPVYNGADDFNLNRGVGRIIGTAPIDAYGNLGIAGHRDGFFRGLKDVAVGDRIELQTAKGGVAYSVSSIQIVDPTDVSVLDPTNEQTITLVTCYPFYYVGHAPKRFIVKATAEHSATKT